MEAAEGAEPVDVDDLEFDRVFRTEFEPVKRTVLLICHNHDTAQELTQDAFLQLVRHWKKVKDFERPGAWVRRVAIRLTIKRLRSEERRRRAEAAMVLPGVDEHDLDVMRAVRQLPPRQRAAVVLRYFEGCTGPEIGQLLGCSEATARVHLHRARQRLTELLEKEVPHVR
jgi:RNA polymerase sigma-70 factor, ECF subfamily